MTCLKTTTSGKLVVELFSGKQLDAAELAELDVNWQFFNLLVRCIKETVAEMARLPTWSQIQARLPQTNQGGACQWQDIVKIVLVAPFLTRGNIAAICRRLERSLGLRVLLGLVIVPSEPRISVYKNHLLGQQFFRLFRLHLLYRLKRQGHLPLHKLAIDGAPLWSRVNTHRIWPHPLIPLQLIRRTFQEINLTWLDFYYPVLQWNQTPTSTVVIYYLLMYWLGFRSLNSLHGWLGTHPEVLSAVGLSIKRPSREVLRRFHWRFQRFVQRRYGPQAPYQSLKDLLRAICADALASVFFTEVFRLDHYRTNEFFFNLFRHKNIIGDPDAMYGRCGTRKTIILGYRFILLVDVVTKLPLGGLVFPGNQSERTAAIKVLDTFLQHVALFNGFTLPRKMMLFADLGYDWRPTFNWAAKHHIRLLLSSSKNTSKRTSCWRAQQRIRVEQAFGDLSEFFNLNRPRTSTLSHVQTFVEIICCARVIQATIAVARGHTEQFTCPSYPAFGRKGC